VKELDIIEQKLGLNQTTEKLIFGTKAKEFQRFSKNLVTIPGIFSRYGYIVLFNMAAAWL
jgi:hypothetical protein